MLVLVLLWFYDAGFGWSWGPLTWLIPSEIFPLKIRTTGQSIAVGVQFIALFALSQTFLTMLCHFKFGAFLFYTVWIAVMTLFIMFFLPETKGIPLESMYTIWGKQWFWRRFVEGAVKQDNFPWTFLALPSVDWVCKSQKRIINHCHSLLTTMMLYLDMDMYLTLPQ